jgi:ribonuclease D
VLVEIARKAPKGKRGLEEVRGMPERTLHREHAELLAAVARGERAEPLPHTEQRLDVKREDAPLVALAQALVRQRCLEAGIAPELVAAQADLSRLVARTREGAPPSSGRPLEGWRRELVGGELIDLLEGRVSLSVVDSRRLAIDQRS